MNTDNKSVSIWEALAKTTDRYAKESYPKVSIIIPTRNSAEAIPITIESLLAQDYPHVEIVVIDAGSTDRTIEVIKGYRTELLRVFAVSHYQPYEMINKGISVSQGEYINVLLPGDYYLYEHTLKHVMSTALDTNKPGLIYSGCLLRDGLSEVRLLFRPLTRELLKKGRQPTSLESCWFHRQTFSVLGKFDAHYLRRGGFDFFCRFVLNGTLRYAFTTRVLTDYDIRSYRRQEVMIHFRETLKIVRKYFGVWQAFCWLFVQRDLKRLFRLWLKGVRVAFLGK